MRTKPLVGERAWFGPRFFGWGWTPVSWEGWVFTLFAVALFVVIASVSDGAATDIAGLVLVGTVLAACIVKGTAPGGPAARREFRKTGREFPGTGGADPKWDGTWSIKPGPRKVL